MRFSNCTRRGFTLLELLVVVSILAVVGSGALIAYSGLEDSAGAAASVRNIASVNRAVRTYVAMNGTYPDNWDALVAGNAAAVRFPGRFLDRLNGDLRFRLRRRRLTPQEVNSLAAIGITTIRVIDTGGGAINRYDNDSDFTNDNVDMPNRLHDDAIAGTGHYGVARTLANRDRLTTVRWNRDLGRFLGLAQNDRVVALGFGANNSMHDQSQPGAVASTPYGVVEQGEYGRYIALFQVRDNGTQLTEARFIGVISPKGEILGEAAESYVGGS